MLLLSMDRCQSEFVSRWCREGPVKMEEVDKEGVQIEMDVVASSNSNEMLAPDTDISTRFSHLETKKKSRLYNYLYGWVSQSQ